MFRDNAGFIIFIEKIRQPPSEEEQYQCYSALFALSKGKELTFRTFDFGADKPLAEGVVAPEENPALGVRGIRLALQKPEQVLLPQLRALLRAGAQHKLKVMFPMVTLPGELAALRSHWQQAKQQLQQQGLAHAPQAKVGIMVEVPAVAYHLEKFCPHLDFFSIGSNDLQQYVNAADRLNQHLLPYRHNLDPNFLAIVADAIAKAKRAGLAISLCGMLASDLAALPLLVGLGLRRLSVAAAAVPLLKEAVRSIDSHHAHQLWLQATEAPDGEEVEQLVYRTIPWTRDPLLISERATSEG